MRVAHPGTDFDSWKNAVRVLLIESIPPDQILWSEQPADDWLFNSSLSVSTHQIPHSTTPIKVPKSFLSLAELVFCHSHEQRWSILYRIAYRMICRKERQLLTHVSDEDVRTAFLMAKAVKREIHKTHAFVRFKKLGETQEGREIFTSWFEPEHRIIELAAPFFRDRFSNMDWSILSPKGCAHWINQQLIFTDPIESNPLPEEDSLELLWKCYYANIFNPARLKLKAMQSEMPKKYWKNLPEADLIKQLKEQSSLRVQEMFQTEPRSPKVISKHPFLDYLKTLPDAPEEPKDT